MDTFRQQSLDANRAKKVLGNTHDRVRNLKRKTDEEYVKIIVDEVNKYFNELSNVSINSKNLPNDKQGPVSSKHNDLLNSITDDIDRIHGKHKTAEDLLTKAVNYMSSERNGIVQSASRLHSRILSHKLRSSKNDRGIMVFTEYFNDEGLTDIKSSQNFSIDKSRSALSLGVVTENKDNSSLIDPDSIEVILEFDEKIVPESNLSEGIKGIYPLSSQIEEDNFNFAMGQSLSKENVAKYIPNADNASIPNADNGIRIGKLQKQALKKGFAIGEEVEGEIGEDTHTEFELLWTDFRKPGAKNVIIESVADAGFGNNAVTIDKTHILIDEEQGNSFSGSNNQDGSDKKDYDEKYLFEKMKNIVIYFKLRKGAKIPGNLTKINILFTMPEKGGFIPSIDYAKSTVTNEDGEVFRPFVDPPNSVENKIQTAKSLMLSTKIVHPTEFRIVLKSEGSQHWEELKEYIGACWEIFAEGNEVRGISAGTTYDQQQVGKYQMVSNSGKIFYIYHDYIRSENKGEERELNIKIAKKVIDTKRNETILREGSQKEIKGGDRK